MWMPQAPVPALHSMRPFTPRGTVGQERSFVHVRQDCPQISVFNASPQAAPETVPSAVLQAELDASRAELAALRANLDQARAEIHRLRTQDVACCGVPQAQAPEERPISRVAPSGRCEATGVAGCSNRRSTLVQPVISSQCAALGATAGPLVRRQASLDVLRQAQYAGALRGSSVAISAAPQRYSPQASQEQSPRARNRPVRSSNGLLGSLVSPRAAQISPRSARPMTGSLSPMRHARERPSAAAPPLGARLPARSWARTSPTTLSARRTSQSLAESRRASLTSATPEVVSSVPVASGGVQVTRTKQNASVLHEACAPSGMEGPPCPTDTLQTILAKVPSPVRQRVKSSGAGREASASGVPPPMGVATMRVPMFPPTWGDKALETENSLQDVGAHTVSGKPSRPQSNEFDHCMEVQSLPSEQEAEHPRQSIPAMEITLSASCSNRTSRATLVEIVEEAAPVSDDSHTSDRIADEWAKALDEQWAAAWASVSKPPEGSLPDTSFGAPMQRSTEECVLGVEACPQPSLSDEGLARALPHVRLTDAMSTLGSGCPVLS